MAKDYEIKLSEVEGITSEDVELLKELGVIHTTWRDYTLMMLNSTAEPLRSIWREKICTSVTHWSFNKGSISEGNVAGTEVLSLLPDALTEKVCDDIFHYNSWKKLTRLNGSKRLNVFLGHYPQESLSNEAALCLKYIVNHWNEEIDFPLTGSMIPEDRWDNVKKYSDIIKYTDVLNKMFKLACMTDGKCLLPDEILTYILERPVNDNKFGGWIDVNVNIFSNGIPSDKFKKEWKSDKIEGFPLNCANEKIKENCLSILSTIYWDPKSDNYMLEDKEEKLNEFFDMYEPDFDIFGGKENKQAEPEGIDKSNNSNSTHYDNKQAEPEGKENKVENKLKSQKQAKNDDFLGKIDKLVGVMFKEDVSMSPCWKKIAICILKNDVSMKYAGFGSTYKERIAREEALAAFSTKQSEKEQAEKNAKALAAKIEKENREKSKIQI